MRISQAHSLVNLKRGIGSLKRGKIKNKWPSLLKSTKVSKTKELTVGMQPESACLYLVVWLAACLLVQTCLKWMPWQSKFNSYSCITEKKKKKTKHTNCKAYTIGMYGEELQSFHTLSRYTTLLALQCIHWLRSSLNPFC